MDYRLECQAVCVLSVYHKEGLGNIHIRLSSNLALLYIQQKKNPCALLKPLVYVQVYRHIILITKQYFSEMISSLHPCSVT